MLEKVPCLQVAFIYWLAEAPKLGTRVLVYCGREVHFGLP